VYCLKEEAEYLKEEGRMEMQDGDEPGEPLSFACLLYMRAYMRARIRH
jgi:hypothetical protein